MLWVYGHCKYFNAFSAGNGFIRQNVRFWRQILAYKDGPRVKRVIPRWLFKYILFQIEVFGRPAGNVHTSSYHFFYSETNYPTHLPTSLPTIPALYISTRKHADVSSSSGKNQWSHILAYQLCRHRVDRRSVVAHWVSSHFYKFCLFFPPL